MASDEIAPETAISKGLNVLRLSFVLQQMTNASRAEGLGQR
jgi:hypothetical protein